MGLRDRAITAYSRVTSGNTPETERLMTDSVNLMKQRLRAWQKLMGIITQDLDYEITDRVFIIQPRQRVELELTIYFTIDDIPFTGVYTSIGNQLTIRVEDHEESIESLIDLGRVLHQAQYS